MQPDLRDAGFLLDMLESARIVVRYVAGKTLDDYLRDEMLRDAVERRVEIIGEAARGLSDAFQAGHPQIPWRPIMAQRHVLAHDYGDIQDEKLWRVARFPGAPGDFVMAHVAGDVERRGRVRITNAGTVALSGAVNVRVLASSDPTDFGELSRAADAGDAVLFDLTTPMRLGPRKSATVRLRFSTRRCRRGCTT